MIVLESNQNHATVHDTEVCPTLPASMGLGGGGYVPMIVDTLVFDKAQVTSKVNGNKPIWGGRCHTISAGNAAQAVVIIREKTDESIQSDFAERGLP